MGAHGGSEWAGKGTYLIRCHNAFCKKKKKKKKKKNLPNKDGEDYSTLFQKR
jgi:hypothetical protein